MLQLNDTPMKKLNILVNNPFKTDWQYAKGAGCEIWVRSAAFDGSKFMKSQELSAKLLERLKTEQQFLKSAFESFINNLNGGFAIIVKYGDVLFAAVDHMRSIPLFYGQSSKLFILSDDANCIRENLECSGPDWLASAEFMLCGYVTGEETLFPEIKQLQAGEQLFFDGSSVGGSGVKLSTQKVVTWAGDIADGFSALLEKKLEQVFKRFLDSVKGRHLVIPLSDGFDSRLIVTMLAKFNAAKVTCVTYSKPGTKILSMAKAIADDAGFPWVFIPYNKKMWRNCIRSGKTRQFVEISHNLHTLPNLQDFPAVKYLSENKLIPADSIFVPGHTAMMYLKGQPLKSGFDAVVSAILSKHYNRWDWSLKQELLYRHLGGKVCGCLSKDFSVETIEDAVFAFESWELRERQPKFIVNAVRTYEYFGYEWRLPLWDKDLVSFWLSIPLSVRNGKKVIRNLLDLRADEKKQPYEIKASNRTQLRFFKQKLMQSPILFYIINKFDLRPSQVPRYWTNPLAFYGISSLKEYLLSYHYNLNAHSLLIKRLYENKYSAEFARSCTSVFTRNITNW